jgi:hypothetical protein
VAAVVLHPRFKWLYFENVSKGPKAWFVIIGRAKLRKLRETTYRQDSGLGRAEKSPEPEPKTFLYLEDILD